MKYVTFTFTIDEPTFYSEEQANRWANAYVDRIANADAGLDIRWESINWTIGDVNYNGEENG